jgi:hypothetical protein
LIENDSLIKKLKPFCIREEIISKDKVKFNNYILQSIKPLEDDPTFNFFVLLRESNVIKKEYDIYQSDEVLEDNYDGT